MNTKDLQLIRKMTDNELYIIEREPLHRLHDLACQEVDRRAEVTESHYVHDPRNDAEDWERFRDTKLTDRIRQEEAEVERKRVSDLFVEPDYVDIW